MFSLIVLVILLILLFKWLFPKHPEVINVYFGVPGSGKTTFAAWLVRWCNMESWPVQLGWWLAYNWPYDKFPKNPVAHWLLECRFWKRRIDVYSNVPVTGAYEVNCKTDLGVFNISDGKLIIDEAGVEFNNRDFKSFSKDAIYFFKYHRHYRLSVDVFSQSDGVHYDRMVVAPWWEKLLGAAAPIKLAFRGGREYNLESLERYLIGQAGSSIKAYLQVHDGDVSRLIDAAMTRPLNDRQTDLVFQCNFAK